MASEFWGERWDNSTSEIARKYMQVAARKRSLVCLAADRNTMAGLFELIESVGPHIAALKTHVDLVDDWAAESWASFCSAANDADLLIFEDRKFADIGKVSRSQMAGIYEPRKWADLVTCLLYTSPSPRDGW